MMPRISRAAACGCASRQVSGGRRRGAGLARGIGGGAGVRFWLAAVLLLVASAPGQAQVSAPGVDTVAVVAFANITGAAEDDWIGFGIAETITADLAGSGAATVVGNDAVQAALRQARAGSGGAVDLSDTPAVQAGRALGARWVVSGGFQRLGRQVRLTARIVDVATAAVRHATTVDGTLDELFDLQDRLSADLRGGLSASPPAMAANLPSPGVATPTPMRRPGAARGPLGGDVPVAEGRVPPFAPPGGGAPAGTGRRSPFGPPGGDTAAGTGGRPPFGDPGAGRQPPFGDPGGDPGAGRRPPFGDPGATAGRRPPFGGPGGDAGATAGRRPPFGGPGGDPGSGRQPPFGGPGGGTGTTAGRPPFGGPGGDPGTGAGRPPFGGPSGAGTGGAGGFAPAAPRIIEGPPPPLAPETLARDAAGRVTIRAVPLDRPLDIDGTLDEGVYEIVEPLTGFVQQQPDEGAPATERTEAWVFYDDNSIYISARAWDSAPESRWVANEMQRDSFQIINNDTFSVAFDTFYDRRNGFAFMVNPIGGFFDYQITDEGNPNSDWNPIWDVRTGRFGGGWTVEMEIPFKSIRFPGGESQVWGIQLGRNVRWKNEWNYITPVAISAGPGMFRLSAAGTLTGLQVPSGNRTFEIKPYGIGSSATNVATDVYNEGDYNGGVDVKYGVTENLTADFTVNTDFAQVEVDEAQINLTRFSLFFPEKREFFLEGRGIFDFGRGVRFGGGGGPGGGGRPGSGGFFGGGDVPTVFFSRRIGLESGTTVPIQAGGRLTGKVGDFTVGALNIQTNDVANVADPTNFTVLRLKRDILRRSAVGALFTGRSVSVDGAGSNEAFGVDGVFSFYDNVNFNGYYAKTRTPGLVGEDESYQAAFTYNGDLYAVSVDHLLVGDHFNPEVGFLRRDDFRRTYLQAKYAPRPAGIEAVRQFTFGGSYDYFETVAGVPETELAQANFQIEFENSDRFSADVQRAYEFLDVPWKRVLGTDYEIPAGEYVFRDYYVSYSMGAQRRLSGNLSLQHGEFYNGEITSMGYSRGRIEVTPQFSFEPSISVNRVRLPDAEFTAPLAITRLTYTFNPRVFFSGLVQFNPTQEVVSTNLRLRWEYRPGSELFVVYNDQRDTVLVPDQRFPMLQNRAFVVKFTRLFRF